MRRILALALVFGFAFASLAHAAAIVGKPAPALQLKDADGQTVKLSDYKGKVVVLEWTNFGCPFVGKHYGSGNMQALQKKYTEEGVVWLSICSSAQGKQGFMNAPEAKAAVVEKGAAPSHFLLDPTGAVGHKYGAKTTPHMFIVNGKGVVVYNGAIDDKPSTDKADIETAKNYVSAALDATIAGKPIAVASTQSYGCSVKY